MIDISKCKLIGMGMILGFLLHFACSGKYEEMGEGVRITTWDEPDNTTDGRIMGTLQREFDGKFAEIKVRRRRTGGQATDDRMAFTTASAGDNAPDCYHAAHFPTIGLIRISASLWTTISKMISSLRTSLRQPLPPLRKTVIFTVFPISCT
jgi:hypothetical protein